MPRTRVKICGISTCEAALWAAEAGADAVGMVFYSAARRKVTIDIAKQIVAALPPFVTPVGLFVDAQPDEILRTAKEVGLRHVQLHGHEPSEYVLPLSRERLRVVKAVPVAPGKLDEAVAPWKQLVRDYPHVLSGILLETATTTGPGGTGIPNDWATILDARDRGAFEGLPPLIVAGGLTPETVGEVVRSIRPYAVDVSSGVEVDGQKARQRIFDFIQNVHAANCAA